MAKRKITVTVDAELVDAIRAAGAESLSSVVNEALEAEVDRRARALALDRMLAEWDAELGSPSDESMAAAEDAFDELDALVSGESSAA